MSDTSVVFNVLGRERVGQALGRVRALFRSAGQEAQRSTRAAATDTQRLDGQIGELERSLSSLNAEFAATGNTELFARMKRDRTLLSQLRRVRTEIGRANDEASRLGDNDRAAGMFSRLASAAGDAGSSLLGNAGTAMTNLSTNLWNLIPAAAAGVAGLSALAPAAYLAGAAIGSLPGIIAGASAAIATLKLGTMGLAENWRAQTTASGGAARAARDMTSAHRAVDQAAKQVTRSHRDLQDAVKAVTRAELDVVEAQEEARRATLAVADAVAEERRRRGELARDLKGANLDVADAVDAVQQAEEDLAFARANGANPEDIEDLDRAHQRAQLTLENAKQRVDELGEAHQKASTTAVDESELVQAAKDRERDAVERVRDAEERHALAIRKVGDAREAEREAVQRLADARKALNQPQGGGGGGGGGPITPKIAKSAQQFLDVLKELQPAFKNLQLNVQEKLFAGLASRFRTMAVAWLPTLNKSLGDMATTFNGIAKTFMDTASKPAFISNIAEGVEGVRLGLDRVGQAAAGPLTTAFGQLAGASKPFTAALGDEVAKVLEDFSSWIDRLSKNGKLDKFFKRATDVMRDTFRMLRSIGSIVGSVISAVFGVKTGSGKDPWKALADSLEGVAAWFKNPENQAKITAFISDIMRWGGEILGFLNSLRPIVSAVGSFLWESMRVGTRGVQGLTAAVKGVLAAIRWVGQNAPKWWDAVKNAAGRAKDWVVTKWNSMLAWMRGIRTRISTAVGGLWDAIKTRFASARDWVVNRANSLVTWFGKLPGRFGRAVSGVGGYLRSAFRSAFNAVARLWNGTVGRLSFRAPGWIPGFGGLGWDMPDIPQMAKGGIAKATPGGTLVNVAEAGQDEVIAPLDRLTGMLGGRSLEVTVVASADSNASPALQALVRALLPLIRYEVRTTGRGSVQKLLGPAGTG